MDQKWTKYSYVCTTCDSLIEYTCTNKVTDITCPCGGWTVQTAVADATINNNNEQKEDSPMNATTDFLERQALALQESIEKKDAYITRLQDEVSQKSQTIYTLRAEMQNFRNSVKEYVIESLRDREIMEGTAEALANICDFELTKTVSVTATVDFEIQVEVPFDVDADDVANSFEFSADSFDYSFDDILVSVQSLQASDDIS